MSQLTSRGWLSTGTRDEPLSRSGLTGRLQRGREARPKSLGRFGAVHHSRQTLTELGAGIGRYAKAMRASGLTGRVVAYDGMPDVASKSGGAVRYPNLSTTHTT